MPVSLTAAQSNPPPSTAARPAASLERSDSLDRESGLPVVEWRPIDAPLRIVGPGRQEVRLRGRIDELESHLAEASERQSEAERSLEIAGLVERGTARFVDRVEAENEQSQKQIRRLAAALGALASENEKLHAELSAERQRGKRLDPGPRSRPERGWRRLFSLVGGPRSLRHGS